MTSTGPACSCIWRTTSPICGPTSLCTTGPSDRTATNVFQCSLCDNMPTLPCAGKFSWIEVLIENRSKKMKFRLKMELWFKDKNFRQKYIFSSKNEHFVQKSEFCSKIRILFKNPNFVQKSEICSKFLAKSFF